jgi:dnd system-associated protein 4
MNTRFSPPKDKADFLKELVDKDSPFNELRDVLFFAAVVGWREGRRVPLSGRGEAIRWDVMSNRLGTEIVMDMIAVATNPDDKELLSEAREGERIAILEEYANGGLEVLKERVGTAGVLPLQTVMVHLLQECLRSGDEAPGNRGLADKVLNL